MLKDGGSQKRGMQKLKTDMSYSIFFSERQKPRGAQSWLNKKEHGQKEIDPRNNVQTKFQPRLQSFLSSQFNNNAESYMAKQKQVTDCQDNALDDFLVRESFLENVLSI